MAEVITTEYGLKFEGFQQDANRVIGIWDTINRNANQFGQNQVFDQQAGSVSRFNNQLASGGKLFEQLGKGPKAVQDEIKRLSAEYAKLVTSQDRASRTGNWRQTEQDIQRVEARIRELNILLQQTEDETKDIKTATQKLGDAIKTAFTVTGILAIIAAIIEVGKKLVEVTGISQTYENQFTRIFDGNREAAKGYLATLQLVADTTNFTFSTLTDNAAKLASRGIIATQKEILGLGDVANFIQKDFGQLNEAILDANNPERWKELGFVVKTQGDKMTLSYGDFSKTVDKTVKGAYEAIQAFGGLAKVQGSTVEAGKTLGGQVSTLQDNFAGLFRTIGTGNTGVLTAGVSLISNLIQFLTGLVKTVQPAFDGLFSVFGKLFDATGGLFRQFGKLSDSGEVVATTGQKIGYFFTKFVIDPFTIVIGLCSAVIEAFNLVIIGSQLAAAKLRGNDGLAASLTKELDETKTRLNGIRDDIKNTFSDMRRGMDAYVRADNQATRRNERRSRLQQDEAENFKQKPTTKKPDAADPKEAERLATGLAKEREKLVAEREKLNAQLAELQDKYDKERFESLDKNSIKYIELKRKYDLEEIDQQRQKLIEIGQKATGTPFFNFKTKAFDVKANTAYTLPSATEDLFNKRKDLVNAGADKDNTASSNAQLLKAYEDGVAEEEKKAQANRENLQKKADEVELAMRQALLTREGELVREAGESEQDYEKRKNEALLQLRLDYYNQLLKLAEQDPTKKADVLGLKETIAGLSKDLDTLKNKSKSGPTDLFDLLGIQFDANAAKNDEIKKVVTDAVTTVIDGANQILQQQISADQERISSIDAQIEAKQNQIDTEAGLAKEGLANDLELRKKERAVLEADRKKALDQQRRDQIIQIGINTVLQESNMALAVAQLLAKSAALGPFGVIAAGISIAAMFALFASSISQIASLPKYHDGDEIGFETAKRRRSAGERQPDEIDIRAQVGEMMVRKESAQPNKLLLKRINNAKRKVGFSDIADLLTGTGVTLSTARRSLDLNIIGGAAANREKVDKGLYQRLDYQNNLMETLVGKTGRRSTVTLMPDGSTRYEDEKGNVRVTW